MRQSWDGRSLVPHELDVIATLTGGLAAALLCGLIAHRLRLSPVVGYLAAGIIVGPFTPGFVAHANLAGQFAELGVILLMFGVGLQFHLHELLAVRRIAVPGAFAQVAVATALGVVVARASGWPLGAGLVYGLAISVASTVVLLRALADRELLHTLEGHVAVGWLVVEDLFTVLLLVLLPAVAASGGRGGALIAARVIAISLAKVALLVALTHFVGRRLIPRLLARVARTRSRELFTLAILVLALGVAVGSATIAGASMALGAFLAGMVVGQSHFAARAASEALPMRDAFAVLFFVSIGMSFDPRAVTSHLGLTVATLAVVVVAKPLVALLVVLLLRKPPRVAVTVAVSLAQIGEFSFILVALARSLKVLPDAAAQPLVTVALASIAINPLMFGLIEPMTRWLEARQPAAVPRAVPNVEDERRVVVVGYGPVGRTLTHLLREQGFVPTVIELNAETVAQLSAEGVDALHGDASRANVLEAAGVRAATTLVFAASGSAAEAVRAAKELNPGIVVIARTAYIHDVSLVLAQGADTIITAEAEVALAMSERILSRLGASPEQMDRVRDRVRVELASAGVVEHQHSPGGGRSPN